MDIKVAIDGPSGVGKSTVSRLLARSLNARYIDTGAMYRALAVSADGAGIKPEDRRALEEFLSHMVLCLEDERVELNGVDLTRKIREPSCGSLASRYSALPIVRTKLVAMQRDMARQGSVVMEGRDIGTVVLKDMADIKFFLDASLEVRALRRKLDEKQTTQVSIDEVRRSIKERDRRDSTRKVSPLDVAKDAVRIDTGDIDVSGVLDVMLKNIKERF